MLEIEDLFEKIKNAIQNNPLYPSSDTTDEKHHYIFGYNYSDVYRPPPPHELNSKILKDLNNFDKTYPAGDLLYYDPEQTLLRLQEKLRLNYWNY